MKIYLVLGDEVNDYEFYHPQPFATQNKELAIKEFKRRVNNAKKAFPNWYCEEYDENVVLYRDGEYSSNHCDIWIEEVELTN